MSEIPKDYGSGPNPEFHIVNNPNSLLTFLQHNKKFISEKVDSWPLKLNFVIEFTYDSIVVIDGYWMNTMELLEIVDLTRDFHILEANLCHIQYIQGRRIKDGVYNDYYEVHIEFDKVDGDGISFSHN